MKVGIWPSASNRVRTLVQYCNENLAVRLSPTVELYHTLTRPSHFGAGTNRRTLGQLFRDFSCVLPESNPALEQDQQLLLLVRTSRHPLLLVNYRQLEHRLIAV